VGKNTLSGTIRLDTCGLDGGSGWKMSFDREEDIGENGGQALTVRIVVASLCEAI